MGVETHARVVFVRYLDKESARFGAHCYLAI